MTGEIPLKDVNPASPLPFSTGAGEQVLYGVTSSPEVKGILVDKKQASIISLYDLFNKDANYKNYKLWYVFEKKLNKGAKAEAIGQKGIMIFE